MASTGEATTSNAPDSCTTNWCDAGSYQFQNQSIWRKDEKMTLFAEDLKAAVAEPIDDPSHAQAALHCIKLNHLFLHDDDPPQYADQVTGREKSSNWIFVRTDARLVWDAVFQKLTNIFPDEKAEFAGRAFLDVTGNSGIGKSYSMIYLLKKFLDAGRYVFFDNRKTKRIYAFIPRKVEHDQVNEVLVTDATNFKERYLLFRYPGQTPPPVLWDPSENQENNFEPSYLKFARTVLCVSMKEELVKNAYKDFAVRTWYLSQYTFQEMQVVRANAYPSVDSQVVRYRYYRYGGLIRLAFADTDELKRFNSNAKVSIETLSMEALETILSGAIGSHFKIVSSGVFRVKPIDGFDFGSPYMYALLAGHFWEQLARKGRGTDKQYTSWFEAMAIHKLSVGGKFQVRRLVTESQPARQWEELELSAVPIETIGRDGRSSVNDKFYDEWGKQLSRTRMLNPATTNVPVVDCADASDRGYQIAAAQKTT